MEKILIIDDDIDIGNLIEETLTRDGYKTARAYSGTEALLVLEKEVPDLILLDLMLPGISREELFKRINNIPVIVISAKIDVDNKVNLLLDGAFDYIQKPFNIKELSARICVALRKSKTESLSHKINFSDIELDTINHTCTVGNTPVKLTRTEFAILKMLMQNQTQVVTKSLLLERISEDTPDCTDTSLKMHISNLRKKIGKDCIESVWGIGFKMREE